MSGSRSRREQAARLLGSPGVGALLRRIGRWPGVLVLNYHRVGDPTGEPWDRTLWSATVEELDQQLGVLAKEAEVIGPRDVAAAVNGARGRHVLLTFDDGYRDNYELAFPVLRRHRMAATFFLATGFIDQPHVPWWDEIAWMVRNSESPAEPDREQTIERLIARYKTLDAEQGAALLDRIAEQTASGRCPADRAAELWMTWDMAREMRSAGMSIGGHTVTHPVLARIPVASQREEIFGCAAQFTQELGEPMRWFAYPVGSRDAFTPDTEAILREAEVELAFSFYGGYGRPEEWNPLDIPRVHIGLGHSRELLRAALSLPGRFARW